MPAQLKDLDNLLITAAAVLGIVGIVIDETIRALVPLVAVLGAVFYAAHRLRQARQCKATAIKAPADAPSRQLRRS